MQGDPAAIAAAIVAALPQITNSVNQANYDQLRYALGYQSQLS